MVPLTRHYNEPATEGRWQGKRRLAATARGIVWRNLYAVAMAPTQTMGQGYDGCNRHHRRHHLTQDGRLPTASTTASYDAHTQPAPHRTRKQPTDRDAHTCKPGLWAAYVGRHTQMNGAHTMDRITTRETANGPAYINRAGHGSVTLVFPHGARPFLVWGTATIPIDAPERFGTTDTHAARLAFVRAFASASTTASR